MDNLIRSTSMGTLQNESLLDKIKKCDLSSESLYFTHLNYDKNYFKDNVKYDRLYVDYERFRYYYKSKNMNVNVIISDFYNSYFRNYEYFNKCNGDVYDASNKLSIYSYLLEYRDFKDNLDSFYQYSINGDVSIDGVKIIETNFYFLRDDTFVIIRLEDDRFFILANTDIRILYPVYDKYKFVMVSDAGKLVTITFKDFVDRLRSAIC